LLPAAVREVAEETGLRVILGRPLSTSRYQSDGQHKRVRYWAGRGQDPPAAFVPNAEVDDLELLSVPAALGRLSYQRDIQMLGDFADGPARTVPCILLRHATAAGKPAWRGHELARPLDRRGAAEAESLARLMSCFGPCRVITSAAERCVATVRPFAALTGAQIELEPLFTVGQQVAGKAAADRAAAIAADGRPVVICAHRENLPLLLDAACSGLRSAPPPAPAGQQKGAALSKGGFWVLQSSEGTMVSAERHRPTRR
jgi:8-oxo-(d)GTP phosphatase